MLDIQVHLKRILNSVWINLIQIVAEKKVKSFLVL